MKKSGLLLLVLATALPSLFAQKSLLISDSTFFNGNRGTPLSLYAWNKHIYNTSCLDSVSQHLYTFQPLDTTQQLSDYYPNGYVYHSISQSWDTAAQTYANHTRATYYYDAANRNTRITTELWMNNSWQPANLSTYMYGTNGYLDTVLYQYWNSTSQTYADQSEEIYSYDSYGHLSSYLSQYYDAASNSWKPSYAFTYLYNASNFLLDFTISAENFITGVYGLLGHVVNYPDNLNRTDSSYNVDYEFADSFRTYYAYYPSSGKDSVLTTYSYQTDGTFINGNISRYYYDSAGTVFNDSIVNESFASAPDDAVLSSTILSQEIRGISGQQLYYHRTASYTNGEIETTESTSNQYGQQTHYIDSMIDANGTFLTGREDRFHYALCSPSALPVTLLSFTGQQRNNDAMLQWQTSNEINTAYFSLQRSVDGVHFTTIYKATASGNSSIAKAYTYTDAGINLLNSVKLYYRLATTDDNGTIAYSKTVVLTIAEGKLSVAVLPNPVLNTIYLYSPVSLLNAQIKITDMNGVLLYTSRQNIAAGARFGIDASRLAKGIYIITVQSQGNQQTFKLVK